MLDRRWLDQPRVWLDQPKVLQQRWLDRAGGLQRRWLDQPRVLDGLAVALGLGLTVLAAKTPWSPLSLPLILVSGTVASIALLSRRRRPLLVAAVGALGYGLSGNPGPLLVAALTAATLPGWRPLLAGLITMAGYVSAEAVYSGEIRSDAFVGGAVATAAILAVGAYARARHEALAAAQARADQAETEQLWRENQARSSERGRIAREMHDVLAHKISLIALHAGALEVSASDAHSRDAAVMIRATARESLDELRTILGLLRPTTAEQATAVGGAFADIDRLVASWADAGCDVTFRNEIGDLPSTTARAAHRLVQEGLTNAVRHAPGSPVAVTVSGRPGSEVTVVVEDRPGTGRSGGAAPPPPEAVAGSGVGLVGLRERLDLLGGELDAGPSAGGWRLRATIPWHGQPKHTDRRA